jgi:transglutaminase-like putative cysteine protease
VQLSVFASPPASFLPFVEVPCLRVQVQCQLAFGFADPTEAIAMMLVADAPGQRVEDEQLTISPGAALVESPDPVSGGRLLRGNVQGTLAIDYTAIVNLSPRLVFGDNCPVTPWSALPVEVLPYLMSSRYCPVDQFLRFATREFGSVPPGGARALAILDWLHANLDYQHGVSTGAMGAAETFIDRAGVCRDFTHLGLTLCRAAGMPARAVAAYAPGLDPPDFHAVFELYLDGRWWLVDPTRRAPVAGLVRIGHGRDAADIAFLTTSGPTIQTAHRVDAQEISGPALVKPSHHPNTVEEAA